MQKVLRRTLLGRNQALRRKRKTDLEELRDSRRKVKEENAAIQQEKKWNIKAERKNRREDWMLGPLAPNRLAGKDAGGYGMLSSRFAQPPTIPPEDREKYLNFAVNDRVVLVTGREKGKIGRVMAISEEKQTVEIADVNVADIKVLPLMREMRNLKTPFTAIPIPVSIHDVRLVVPLRDNLTGRIKDTVVEYMRGGEPIQKPRYGLSTPEHTRYIAGSDNIIIPWPTAGETRFLSGPSDTTTDEARRRSFTPWLSYEPHPASVVDELRNKYSRTRTDHTRQYIEEKMTEDAKEQWQRRRRMLLPQQEYWERKAEARGSEGKVEVTTETRDLIRDMRRANTENSSPDKEKTAIS